MKKRKILLALTLAILTTFTSLFGVIAQASTNDDYEVTHDDNVVYKYDKGFKTETVSKAISEIETADDDFYFERGASISLKKKNVLAFRLNTKNAEAVTYEKGLKDTTGTQWYEYEYMISLIRKNTNDTYGSEVSAWVVNFSTKTEKYRVQNLIRAKSPYTAEMAINCAFDEDKLGANTLEPLHFSAFYDDKGNVDKYQAKIYFEVDSAFDEYTAVFSYTKRRYNIAQKFKFKWPWQQSSTGIGGPIWEIALQTNCTSVEDSLLRSDERTYDYVLQKAIEAGEIKLEAEDGDTETDTDNKETWENIVNGGEQQIKVEYLANIGDTPFAEKVQKQITIKMPANTTTLTANAVASALNVPHVNCLLSACKGFTLDSETGYYVAEYANSVWLSSKTADGNTANYFLDPNLSFDEYYGKLVSDGIISDDLYDYVYYSKIMNDYKELNGRSPKTLYGYFGYVVIPETFTLNQVFADIFNVETEINGLIKNYEYKQSLSLSAYDKLLQEYDYSWLERVWNDAWGALTQCNANHYLIYADVTTTDAYINENGSENIENTNGLIINSVQKIEEVLSSIGLSFDSKSGSIIAAVIVAGAVVVLIVIIGKKNGKKGSSKTVRKSRRRTSNKRKRK